MTQHLLTLADLTKAEFEALFKRAVELKEKKQKDAEGFIRLNALRLRIQKLIEK